MGPAEKIAKSRAQPAKKGAALRVLYDAMMPEALLQRLVRKLRLDKLDTIQPSGRYQNHKGLHVVSFLLPPKDLKYPAWPGRSSSRTERDGIAHEGITDRDRFVHVPYQNIRLRGASPPGSGCVEGVKSDKDINAFTVWPGIQKISGGVYMRRPQR